MTTTDYVAREVVNRLTLRCDLCQTALETIAEGKQSIIIGCPRCSPDKGQPAPVKREKVNCTWGFSWPR